MVRDANDEVKKRVCVHGRSIQENKGEQDHSS